MTPRKSFPESCEILRAHGVLGPDEWPSPLGRQPSHDDDAGTAGIRWFRTRLADVALDRLTLAHTYIARSELLNVTLRDCDLSGSTLNSNDLIDVDFSGSDLSGCDMRGCIFERVSFRGANLGGADVRLGRFRDCDFAEADLTGARLSRLFGAFLPLSRAQRRTIAWSWRGLAPEEG